MSIVRDRFFGASSVGAKCAGLLCVIMRSLRPAHFAPTELTSLGRRLTINISSLRDSRLARRASVSLFLCFVLCACGASAAPHQEDPQMPLPSPAPQSTKKAQRASDPNKFALIVAGVGGEAAYTKKFTAQAIRLYEALTSQLGFVEKNVYLLTEVAVGGAEDGAQAEAPASRRSTAEEVRKSFASIKSAANAEGFVLVVLIGHGSFDNQQAKFNLVGPDLSAKDYAALLAALPNKRTVFVNCASSSGEFIKPLSAEGRIVITATRSGNE